MRPGSQAGGAPAKRQAPLTERLVARAQRIGRRFGLHVLTESLESPVARMPPPDSKIWNRRSALAGVRFDSAAQVRLLELSLAPYVSEFDSVVRFPATGPGFPLWNGYYQAGDAELLYAIIRHFRPRRILELGSGYSTFVSAAAALQNAREGSPADLTAVDPAPRAELSAGIEGLARVELRDSRELSFEWFDELGPNDILFIDSSHAVKLGGELQWLVLDVLPRLRQNVLVHFHDVFLPYEYPRPLFELWPYFNEQYLLHAFLIGNSEWEVLLGAAVLLRDHPERVQRLMPSLSERRPSLPWSPYLPGAFWLQRRAVARS
jgi:hypothetical protein